MKIIYLGYWGANEGLSQSTINPHLEILASFEKIEEIIYVSIERNKDACYKIPDHSRIKHQPFFSKHISIRLFNKILDIVRLRRFIFNLIKLNQVDWIFCRSSLAGIFGYMSFKKFKIPYIVESFEPHADYMLELGIWTKNSISFQMQTYWEKKQKATAEYLLPVSHGYEKLLRSELGKDKNIITVPCGVDAELFKYDENKRFEIRNLIGIPSKATVGIYVGKFGGIYFDDEAFEIFKVAFNEIADLRLIILSSTDVKMLDAQIKQFLLPRDRIYINMVSHSEVPNYLSASDFAFSLIRPTPFRSYCCPIKNGEYWASGLPIVIPDGIGDDSKLIRERNIGFVFDSFLELNLLEFKSFINGVISLPRINGAIHQLAHEFRSYLIVKKAYERIIE